MNTESNPLFNAASITLRGELPKGDPRIWAHSVTDLVAGFIRDDKTGQILDANGVSLQKEQVEVAIASLKEAGVLPGEVVIIESYNDLNAVAYILGTWLMGCAVCPMDPDTPAEVKAVIARESGARVRVQADASIIRNPDVQKKPEIIQLRRPKRITGSDLALFIFTSGSSGAPKGVILSHQNVMSALRSISRYLKLRSDDRILCVPPLFFDYGLYQLLLTIFNECSLILNGKQNSAVMLLKMIEQTQPTVLPVVPALAAGLARMFGVVGKTSAQVRLITNTGGHLTESTIQALGTAFPDARIVPMYGLTESKRALFLDTDLYPGRITSVGQAMPALEAVVMIEPDDGGTPREALPHEVGELYVRGSSVMQGYHRVDSASGVRLLAGNYRDDNWLATGDLFARDEDGLFYFRGRSKTLIKQGGYCISPRDIEILSETHEQIIAARVVGRNEENGDESAILFVQLPHSPDKETKKKIIADLKVMIHKTLMPREVHFIDEWPATPNGKIDAKALVEMAKNPKGTA